MNDIQWWDIPLIAAGLAAGSYVGNITSLWIKRKLGWIGEDK